MAFIIVIQNILLYFEYLHFFYLITYSLPIQLFLKASFISLIIYFHSFASYLYNLVIFILNACYYCFYSITKFINLDLKFFFITLLIFNSLFQFWCLILCAKLITFLTFMHYFYFNFMILITSSTFMTFILIFII